MKKNLLVFSSILLMNSLAFAMEKHADVVKEFLQNEGTWDKIAQMRPKAWIGKDWTQLSYPDKWEGLVEISEDKGLSDNLKASLKKRLEQTWPDAEEDILGVRFAALEEAKKKMASLDKDKKEEAKKNEEKVEAIEDQLKKEESKKEAEATPEVVKALGEELKLVK